MAFSKEEVEALQARVKEKAKPIIRESMATPFTRNCWNPECGYGWPIAVTHCKKCGWSKDGPPGRVSITKAKAIDVERDRGMNKTERKYSLYLKALLRAGEIAWFEYEPIKLRLADACQYIPDFMVVTKDGHIEIHDTKAWWAKAKKVGIEGDSLVKMKGIAEKYPMFKVLATWEKDGKWEQRVF